MHNAGCKEPRAPDDGLRTSSKESDQKSPTGKFRCLIVRAFILGLLSVSANLSAAENFFIVWGPLAHSDQATCVHRPQDPHFPLPNQLSYTAYFESNPDAIVTERSPKWNIRDDPSLPGNGYYGVEVGNLHEALARQSGTLIVRLTCYGAREQAAARIPVADLRRRHHQQDMKLGGGEFPDVPSRLEVTRDETRNIIRWSSAPRHKYDLYRCNLSDTLADGRPKRVYQRIVSAIKKSAFADEVIDPSDRYGYLVIAEDERGGRSGHSVEAVDLPTGPGPIYRLAPFADGRVALTHARAQGIKILDEGAKTVAIIEPGALSLFSVDSRDRLWVLNPSAAGLREVNIYSSGGKQIKTIKIKPPRAPSLKGTIVDFDIDGKRRLWVLTPQGISVFDQKLRERGTVSFANDVIYPTSISVHKDRIGIADPVGQRIKLYRFQKGAIQDVGSLSTGHLEPWDLHWLNDNELAVSGPFDKVVSSYHINGELVGSFEPDVVGSFRSPRALALRKDHLYAADGERILILPSDLTSLNLKPMVTFGEPGQATLFWTSTIATRTAVRYWPENGVENVETVPGFTRTHAITVTDLPPVTRINYGVSSPLRTIPPSPWTERFDFATPLWEPGKTAILRLPLAVILHTHAVDLDQQPKDHPHTAPIPPSEVERIKKQIQDAVLFYWHNSRMKLFLDVAFFTNEAFLDVAPFGEHPAPDPERVEAFLNPLGHHVSDYLGILRIIAEQRYDPEKGRWVLAGPGGGFTWGINPIDSLPGASWWRATPEQVGSGNDWLMTHEFHHQLDAMFHESGHTEYPFNHFSPLEYSGPFGEHYDGNAYILRAWPQTDWFLLKWGHKGVVDDRDGDGIPDDAPWLPSDEKRLGSSSEENDTDGDGLTDMEEVLLSNWVVQGTGEDWGGPIHLPNLTSSDSDGDGLSDRDDPFPLYALDPLIQHQSPIIDGLINQDEWSTPYRLQDDRGQGDFFFGWDEDYLYGAAILQPPAAFHLQIDANGDGWFVGRDNLIFRFTPNLQGDEPHVEVSVFVCDEQPEKYPYTDPELFPAERIRAQNKQTRAGYVLEFAIPKSDTLGLSLTAGERIGINAGCYFDQTLHRRVTLFEPHRIITLTLGE